MRLQTWGGGIGRFYQLGNIIGVEWEVLPDWGEVTEGVRSKTWQVPERVARQWFDDE